jgi:hypothetical protein
MLNKILAANQKGLRFYRKENSKFMKKFLLGLVAVAAILLPMTQSAQAHWGCYHRSCGYHVCEHRRCWHHGCWYGGCWHAGYWGWDAAPVAVIVAP